MFVFRNSIGFGQHHRLMVELDNIDFGNGGKENPAKKDTFHLYLTDQKGRWTSNTTGRLYQCNFDKGNLNLSSQDSTLYIIHLMSDSILTGIHDMGIRLSLPSRINTEENKK